MPDEVITFLAVRAGGDARTALNALELAIATAQRGQEPRVTLGDAEDALQRKAVLYDKAGDQHYDYISAWIKSTRGSDPDASLYYLAAMVEGGEDPRFIARRMIVLASEDIGNADPQALPIAVAAAHAVEHVGFPEAEFALAQAAIYLSLAPKSDAVKRAIGEVHGHIREPGTKPPPARAALGRLPGGAQAGPREGLRLPARPPRPRQRPGAPARRPRGPALLLPRRGRARGARPPRGDAEGPRAGVTAGEYPSRSGVREGHATFLLALIAMLLLAAPASAARFQKTGTDIDFSVTPTDVVDNLAYRRRAGRHQAADVHPRDERHPLHQRRRAAPLVAGIARCR